MCYKSPRRKCTMQCCQRPFKHGIHFLWTILLDECATEPIWGNDLLVTFLRTYYTPDALPALRLLVLQCPHYPILQMRASRLRGFKPFVYNLLDHQVSDSQLLLFPLYRASFPIVEIQDLPNQMSPALSRTPKSCISLSSF